MNVNDNNNNNNQLNVYNKCTSIRINVVDMYVLLYLTHMANPYMTPSGKNTGIYPEVKPIPVQHNHCKLIMNKPPRM